MQADDPEHPYDRLTPERILDAVEDQGYHCDGRLLALNSYENRVYQVGLENERPLIAKFYRPNRWSREAILEEHAFSGELAEHEIPVIAPLASDGQTLHLASGFHFALFPQCGGRWPDLETREQRLQMGRFLGRLHAVGASRPFRHRPQLDIDSMGEQSRSFLLGSGFIDDYLHDAYASLTADLIRRMQAIFALHTPMTQIRLHGDCHKGNILWTGTGPHFVDLDDTRTGPPVQDLWMLLSGNAAEMRLQLDELLEGYQTFSDFDYSSVALIESLRTLRMMNYAAWIAHRWNDPAFRQAFPWFDSPRYWEEHILSLREQAALLDEPLVH